MRALLPFLLFVAFSALAASQPASDASRVNSIAVQALLPVMAQHFGELRGMGPSGSLSRQSGRQGAERYSAIPPALVELPEPKPKKKK